MDDLSSTIIEVDWRCKPWQIRYGNDSRGIDVGIYSRFPLGGIWTHMFDNDERSSTDRLLYEAEQIACKRQRRFRRLKQSSEEYKALEDVRQIRNKLIHATEVAVPIDQGVGASEFVASLSIENYRRLLSLVRKALVHIVKQVPETCLQVRLDDNDNVIWLDEREVP